jgi:hypothetical protein
MSFVKIDSSNFENITLNVKPSVSFTSSSATGEVFGSSYVSPTRSKTLKKIEEKKFESDGGLVSGIFSAVSSPKNFLELVKNSNNMSYDLMSLYMQTVNMSSKIDKHDKTIDIFRFDQPERFDQNKNIKNIVRNVLMENHKHRYDNCGFYFSNYNSLNFFASENIPTGSALLYPNLDDGAGLGVGIYDLPGEFCTNFWINPRYSNPGEYHAGTVLHISSSVSISLISGSSKDQFNGASDFKILLQLSQSADIPPSQIDFNNLTYPSDLVFTSSFTLEKNSWHNVNIQWGANVNNGHGSIHIDDNVTEFYIPSSSVSANENLSPAGVVVGNYYDGDNSNLGSILRQDIGVVEGFSGMNPSTAADPVILENTFSHPLNAEVHEIKLFNRALKTRSEYKSELQLVKEKGPSSLDNLIFYVPPFFFPDTPEREVLVSPFQKITSKTDDPINVAFSFGVNGKLINLENYTREFVQGQNPRLIDLTPNTINTTVEDITADEFIYHTGSHVKRNMTILPNDNGLFRPNYSVLEKSYMSGSNKYFEYGNGTGSINHEIVSLNNLIPVDSLYPGLVHTSGSIFDTVVSASANNPGVNQGAVLTVAQRTRDISSNEIVIYDISNLYYGNRIHPGTFQIHDKNLTGSNGMIGIKLKDNSRGSLYRADSNTPHATWNSVGNLFYDEGIAIVKTPHLMYLSKDETNIEFKGEQNIHTMILNIPAYKEMFNSSSNPTFKSIPPSDAMNDKDKSSLYITTVNIHDDNFNIIMKANFSQPIIKSEDDEFIVRLKEDF